MDWMYDKPWLREKIEEENNICFRERKREDMGIKGMSFIIVSFFVEMCIQIDKIHVQKDYFASYLHLQPHIYLFT